MRIEALALRLRPRPMNEAADLGVRMVQAHRRSLWLTFAPLYLVTVVLAATTMEIATWLPATLIFWLKPWLDRSLLFVLSRAVFGQPTRLADLWRERRVVWLQQLPSTLTLRRLSPWRAFTQPIYQLEGQSGAASRARRKQLLNLQRGRVGLLHFVFANTEAILLFGVMAMIVWLLPSTMRWEALGWFFKTGSDDLAQSWLGFGVYAAIVLMLEPFYVAAGFAMYLNRRVELEAWDVEQEFRRAFGR